MALIDPNRIHEIFLNCMFKDEEIVNGKPTSPYKAAEGITINLGFHEGRLNENSAEVVEILGKFPKEFYRNGGGGWSFLNMCTDVNGDQWGEQRTVEEIILLGIALEKVKFQMPREMWSVLPGGVPYVVIDMDFNQ